MARMKTPKVEKTPETQGAGIAEHCSSKHFLSAPSASSAFQGIVPLWFSFRYAALSFIPG